MIVAVLLLGATACMEMDTTFDDPMLDSQGFELQQPCPEESDWATIDLDSQGTIDESNDSGEGDESGETIEPNAADGDDVNGASSAGRCATQSGSN